MDEESLNLIPFSVITVDFKPEATTSVEFFRVHINWNVNLPLKFQKNFQFSPGVNTLLRFRYERLKGFCDLCGMITHDSGDCLNPPVNQGQGSNMDEENNDDGPDHGDPPSGEPDVGNQNNDLDDLHNPEDVDQQNLSEDASQSEESGSQGACNITNVYLRRQRFVDHLLESCIGEGSNLLTSPVVKSESEEDDDHIILEMEERITKEKFLVPLGDWYKPGGSGSVSVADGSKKRAREEDQSVDKFPVGAMKLSKKDYDQTHALKKIQADYGTEDEDNQEMVSPAIDKGAVGLVPPD